MSGWAFTSYPFWVFLGAVVVCHWLAPARFRNGILLIGSYVFYASWDWRFVALVLLPTVTDFFLARGIAGSNDRTTRKRLLLVAIGVDCGVLGWFKYHNFFADQVREALHHWGMEVSGVATLMILPVGISYFMFTSLGYVVDVYRRQTTPTARFLDHALFLVFFPKLVAGPIERARSLLPQIAGDRRVDLEAIRAGSWFVLWGLFCKLVVADGLSLLVNGLFSVDPARLTGLECWTGAYACALQIYCDFWGYSAVAVGVSRWLGFGLTLNFRMPYFSRNPSEFWSRWHVSLSTWLRDFVFLPLSYWLLRRLGSRRWLGLEEEYWSYFGATVATMLVAGLWHGAGLTFVLWGLGFALLLCSHRAWLGYRKRFGIRRIFGQKMSAFLGTLAMFHLACIGWVVFRAESLGQARAILARMFTSLGATSVVSYGLGMIALLAGPLFLLEYWLLRRGDGTGLLRAHWVLRGAVYSYMVIMIMLFSPVVPSEFIYFRF